MKDKKILIIIPYFIPAYSYWWPIKVAYDQAIWLQKEWYDITVITTDALDTSSRIKKMKETIDWLKIYRFKNISNKLAKFHNIHLPLWMNKRLKQNIQNYNIVHIHDILNIPAILWSKIARKNKIKYFLHPHGTLSDTRIKSRKSIIKETLLKVFSKMMNWANWIFALTKQEEKEISKYTKNKNIFNLPNWLDLKEFEDIEKTDLRKKYKLNKDCTIFTFLWRIQYIKWLDIAFKLLSEYNKTNTNRIYLIIWPDEWEKDKLVALAKKLWIDDKIIWFGMTSWKEKLSLLASGDIFLFTSRAEGFPMTILEALACWLPAFISTWCNLPKIELAECGRVVVNKNIKENLKKLEAIIKEKERYKKNIKDFLWNYEIKNLLKLLINYYNIHYIKNRE